MAFDNVCKILAETYPTEFARWLLPEVPQTVKVLKTELSIEPIRADSVIFLQTENRILHLEFQTTVQSDIPMNLRMLDYYVRLVRKYNLPITQVVIFLQETNNPLAFVEEYRDEMTIHRYRVIRMWEQETALFLDNQALLPLAPLTKTKSPENLLSQIGQRFATIPDEPTQQNIATYTEILAGLRFNKDLIYQFLKEDLMKESVIYQDIFQKGEGKGEKRGKQQEAFQFLIRLLNRRFGKIDSSLSDRLRTLPQEQLESLGEALFDFTDITEVETWLNQQT